MITAAEREKGFREALAALRQRISSIRADIKRDPESANAHNAKVREAAQAASA